MRFSVHAFLPLIFYEPQSKTEILIFNLAAEFFQNCIATTLQTAMKKALQHIFAARSIYLYTLIQKDRDGNLDL